MTEKIKQSIHSPQFEHLLEPENITSLLRGSHVDGDYKKWENDREFIAEAIDKDGTNQSELFDQITSQARS